MPKALERKLKAKARKMGLSKKRAASYVYGTLRKTGWRPSREKTHKGGRKGDGALGYKPLKGF